jgi:hypothetical protein
MGVRGSLYRTVVNVGESCAMQVQKVKAVGENVPDWY